MIFSIFDPQSKIIIGHINCSDENVDFIRQTRTDIVDGYYDAYQWRVDQGHVVPVESAEQDMTPHLKNHRNTLLSAVDRVNPVWYAALTVDQQQELITYRQQLLDVPQQTSFPTQVEWPAKPAWL